MTFVIIRFVIYAAVAIAIFLGVRRIWRDWTGHFRAEDKAIHERDLRERQRPDVIELKRDGDGIFRPDDRKDRR